MFNKTLKTLIALTTVISLSSNLVFAEITNIKNPGTPTSNGATIDKNNKIDIVKDQIKQTVTTTTTTVSAFNGNLYSKGNAANGNKGVTFAAAYLTPENKFGYAYVENYDYDGSGTAKTLYDPLNPSYVGRSN